MFGEHSYEEFPSISTTRHEIYQAKSARRNTVCFQSPKGLYQGIIDNGQGMSRGDAQEDKNDRHSAVRRQEQQDGYEQGLP
jgi:hypothetical protein